MNREQSGYLTTRGERISYWSYFVGQSMSYTMLSSFLTIYMTMIGLENIVVVAIAMLVVKVWDAVNDVIFGAIFDKMKFKNGQKSIPWLLGNDKSRRYANYAFKHWHEIITRYKPDILWSDIGYPMISG